MIIVTRYDSHPTTGAGRILATAAGHRFSFPYNHAARDPHADAACRAASRLALEPAVTETSRPAGFPAVGNRRYWKV